MYKEGKASQNDYLMGLFIKKAIIINIKIFKVLSFKLENMTGV